MADLNFIVRIADYERPQRQRKLTPDRIERMVAEMLEREGSDGIVIVAEMHERYSDTEIVTENQIDGTHVDWKREPKATRYHDGD